MTNNSVNTTIESICFAFGCNGSGFEDEIPKAQVLRWMRSDYIEVRGCVYSMVADLERARHINPPLEFEDYYDFVVPYLEQCIEENLDIEWVESRYLAGHALVGWIVNFWNNESEVPRKRLEEIKHGLAALYKRGDSGVRDAIVNAVLEHLFEHRQLAKYFKDWEADPLLAQAYSDAMLWTNKGVL